MHFAHGLDGCLTLRREVSTGGFACGHGFVGDLAHPSVDMSVKVALARTWPKNLHSKNSPIKNSHLLYENISKIFVKTFLRLYLNS
jgi:hypothetical protein